MTEHITVGLHISRRSGIPIYQQLQKQLEDLIANGTWRAREPLPSETELAAQLGISVMTVRQAMAQLVNKGLIYREKGRGTFVAPRPLEHSAQRLESFTKDMRARGHEPSAQTLLCEVVPAPAQVAADLELFVGAPVLHLRRLRLVDGCPVALHDAYVTRTDITRAELDAVGSLYALLEQRGIELGEAHEVLEAIVADTMTAELLGIRRGAPLIRVTRTTWDRYHTPIETIIALYRADLYHYSVILRR